MKKKAKIDCEITTVRTNGHLTKVEYKIFKVYSSGRRRLIDKEIESADDWKDDYKQINIK